MHTDKEEVTQILNHIKADWLIRLPYRTHNNRYRGMSRICYALLCLLYYTVKDVILLLMYLMFRVYKLILWDIWQALYYRFYCRSDECDDEPEIDEVYEDEFVEELPFCQLFFISDNMSLLIDHVEMCPDETAFIRVADDESFTPLYKRKVRRDKSGNRFIVFNGVKHYLNDSKTQPVTIKK